MKTLQIEERIGWIKSRVEAAHATGIAIPVSGGKDSTVVLGLAVKAVGAQNVTAVTMPCGSLNKDINDAQRICDFLGVDLITIDIKKQYESILGSIESIMPMSEMAKSNIMPRIRMTTIYSIAQTKNQLVIGTDNKSEKTMGYFTKWGDGAYDFNPIDDLVVSEVIALGKALGLPIDLVEKVPSAGLWDGQTDEAEMGVTYAAIEEYIKTGNTDPESQAIIEKTHGRTMHKRELPYGFKAYLANFKDHYLANRVYFESIYDSIDAWHQGLGQDQSLNEYLNLTTEEYKVFVIEGDDALKSLLDKQLKK